jgi:hypothetical protein
MKGEAQIDPAEMALVIGTRAALGVGLGFLLGNCLTEEQRRVAGWTLLLGGGFVAATLGWEIFGHPRPLTIRFGKEQGQRGQRPDAQERPARPNAVGVS